MASSRVIAHVDLDCFYCQAHVRLDPTLKGKPIAVQQWNNLVAISYEARAKGVQRFMHIQEAKRLCPDLVLIKTALSHGKISNELYREASRSFFDAVARFGHPVEKASCDECYIDLSAAVASLDENGYAELSHQMDLKNACSSKNDDGARPFRFCSYSTEKKALTAAMAETHAVGAIHPELLSGAAFVARIRHAVEHETGMRCSAGIGHSKLIAKVASGLHKPAQMTIVSTTAAFLRTRQISEIPLFGMYSVWYVCCCDLTHIICPCRW
jgi:DNA polymerase eta